MPDAFHASLTVDQDGVAAKPQTQPATHSVGTGEAAFGVGDHSDPCAIGEAALSLGGVRTDAKHRSAEALELSREGGVSAGLDGAAWRARLGVEEQHEPAPAGKLRQADLLAGGVPHRGKLRAVALPHDSIIDARV